MNKKQWTAVIKAYIWSIASSATDFTESDIDILGELCIERKYTEKTEEKPKKSELDYNEEYESVLKK
jgi:hypothetical protein